MEAHIHFSPTHLLQASYHFFCKNHKKKHQQGDKSLVPPNSKLLLSLEWAQENIMDMKLGTSHIWLKSSTYMKKGWNE
jgi:hypothetical protein